MKENTVNRKSLAAILGLTTLAGAAMGQNGNFYTADSRRGDMFINEVWNDPNSGDAPKEFIEIYSESGSVSLDGLAIIVIQSVDTNDDGVVDSTEIDESFIFPSNGVYKTNSAGYFVLWNSDSDLDIDATNRNATYDSQMLSQADDSEIYARLPESVRQTLASGAADSGPGRPNTALGDLTTRYEASFDELGTLGDSNDKPGQLTNDDSRTFLLVDFAGSGLESAEEEKLHKDGNPDADLDGKIEINEVGGTGEELQIIDSVAVSDNGGAEYTYCDQEEWDVSPGFNPDAMTRLGVCTDYCDFPECEESTIDGSDNYKWVYYNWAMGELSGSGSGINLVFNWDGGSDGFGGLAENCDGDVSLNSLPSSGDVALTPGEVNTAVNSVGPNASCPATRNAGDLTGDGVVDVNDIHEAIKTQDPVIFRKVLSNLD